MKLKYSPFLKRRDFSFIFFSLRESKRTSDGIIGIGEYRTASEVPVLYEQARRSELLCCINTVASPKVGNEINEQSLTKQCQPAF